MERKYRRESAVHYRRLRVYWMKNLVNTPPKGRRVGMTAKKQK